MIWASLLALSLVLAGCAEDTPTITQPEGSPAIPHAFLGMRGEFTVV